MRALTWNIEGIKPHQHFLADLLQDQLPDIALFSEPQIYQSDISPCISSLGNEYCFYLNSDDLYDMDLPLVKSQARGGTLALWRKWLDPYVNIHPVKTSSFLPLVLQLPGTKTSVHIGLYLPTSGKEEEFVSEACKSE